MNPIRKLAVVVVALGSVSVAQADLIYEQPMDPSRYVLFSEENGQHIADQFILDSGSTVDGVSWYGGYSGGIDASIARQFTILVYDDDGGLPDSAALFSASVVAAGVDTFQNGTFYSIFKYSVDLADIYLAADTQYWLSILEADVTTGRGSSNPSTAWRWQASDIGTLVCCNPSDWHLSDQTYQRRGDMAFALHGYVTPVPEPGTLALFGIGLAAMGLARRRTSRASS